jgi:hypothetical protein
MTYGKPPIGSAMQSDTDCDPRDRFFQDEAIRRGNPTATRSAAASPFQPSLNKRRRRDSEGLDKSPIKGLAVTQMPQ